MHAISAALLGQVALADATRQQRDRMREEAMQVGERFRVRACVECTEVRRERGESWVWIRLCGGTSIPSGGQRGRRRHHRTQDGKERTCAKLAGARPIAIDPLAESLEGAQHTREVESVREQHESADCEAKRRLAILRPSLCRRTRGGAEGPTTCNHSRKRNVSSSAAAASVNRDRLDRRLRLAH
jgi:hypothetical protein